MAAGAAAAAAAAATEMFQPPNPPGMDQIAVNEEELRQREQAEAARHPFNRDPSKRWWRRLAAKLRRDGD